MRTSIISAVSATVAAGAALALPALASAQGIVATSPQQGIIGLIQFANTALNDVMVLLITAAIVAFFWGMVRFINGGARGDSESRAEGLQTIMYSLIAVFVMVSIWGVIHLLQATFGVNNSNSAETPAQIQIGGTLTN